jgi:hypothetical protein
MSIIIEDGTAASASANSYVTVAEVDTFCSNYGLTSWATLATANKESAIIRGMSFIETFNFKGYKTSVDNPLEWPRACVYDDNPGNYIAGIEVYINEIPKGLKRAVCRAAYEESEEQDVLQQSADVGIKRQKVDVIEIEYEGRNPAQTVYPVIKGFLKNLIEDSGMVVVKRV